LRENSNDVVLDHALINSEAIFQCRHCQSPKQVTGLRFRAVCYAIFATARTKKSKPVPAPGFLETPCSIGIRMKRPMPTLGGFDLKIL
jgi:hypothetical protein